MIDRSESMVETPGPAVLREGDRDRRADRRVVQQRDARHRDRVRAGWNRHGRRRRSTSRPSASGRSTTSRTGRWPIARSPHGSSREAPAGASCRRRSCATARSAKAWSRPFVDRRAVDVVAWCVEDDPRLRRMAVFDAVGEQHGPQGRPHPAGRRRPAHLRRRPRRDASRRSRSCGRSCGAGADSRWRPTRLEGLDADPGRPWRRSRRDPGRRSWPGRGRGHRATDRRAAGGRALPAIRPRLAGDPLAAVLSPRPAAERRTPLAHDTRRRWRMRRWNGWSEEGDRRRTSRERARDLLDGADRAGLTAAGRGDSRTCVAAVPAARLCADAAAWTTTRRRASATPAARACRTGWRCGRGRIGDVPGRGGAARRRERPSVT